jgi:hypothetical protein
VYGGKRRIKKKKEKKEKALERGSLITCESEHLKEYFKNACIKMTLKHSKYTHMYGLCHQT